MARKPGVVAGLGFALTAFRLIDPAIVAEVECPDGSRLRPGDPIATISGPARGILTAERTALNFLCHLSGVASATRGVVDAIAGPPHRRGLHPQDHAGPARGAEIRRAGRRRIKPPLRPR